jgi:alpha-N-arabinofuranosidase
VLTASLVLHPAFTVAPVNPRTFGSFVEHMGRCVYTGIYEPGHAAADEDGFRTDVLDLVRELGVTTVRYPGGNFVSGYKWEDGVGPVEQRPRRLDLAWHSLETNRFGLGEFMRWTAKAGVEPMLAINLGTRMMQEALDLLEYTNVERGTALSDLRRSHGAEQPYGVRMWCLGNEMDGPWQIGHKTPAEYGRLAEETARAMRMIDPGLELVACGSSNRAMPTFGAWEGEVLEHAYDQVDFVSAHAYYHQRGDDLGSHLANALDMDAFIDSVVSTADAVRARKKRTKRINISFDEWNVWDQDLWQSQGPPTEWAEAPRLIEDEYTVADAVVVGNLLISLLRHSDRVTSASIAQLVNVIGPIRSEPGGPAWRQTIFYPFAEAAALAKGVVLHVEVLAPTYETAEHGDAPVADAAATYDEEAGELVLFAVSREQSQPVSLEVDLRGFGGTSVRGSSLLAEDDVRATNTERQPDRVVPREHDGVALDAGRLTVTMPPVSWNVVRIAVDRP